MMPYLWKRNSKKAILGIILSSLAYMAYRSKTTRFEPLRIGMTGSLTLLASEMTFYFIDTINMRSKVLNTNKNCFEMFRDIIKYEGVFGLTKGIQASFYGAIIYGFTYFYLYKQLKEKYKKYIGDPNAAMFMLTSCVTQMMALCVFYPFDMIKVRLQTSNHLFKYKGLKDAFLRIYYQHNSLKGLYTGFPMYLCTYVCSFTLSLTLYELMIAKLKKSGEFERNEYKCVISSSALSGLISALFTNPLEVLTVRKQTDPKTQLMKVVKKEKYKLLTKGLAARGCFNSLQAMTFFTAANFFGNIYNVELTE